MKTLHQLTLSIFLITALAGCTKETIIEPAGNETTTGQYTNEELASSLEANPFYVVADVEGVPGQAKLLLTSNYHAIQLEPMFGCFGGGYSSYEVTMHRNTPPAQVWLNYLRLSFDSGMVYSNGYVPRTGSFTYVENNADWNNNLRFTLYAGQTLYSKPVNVPTNLFEITFIDNAAGYCKGRFNVTLTNGLGKTVTLKNGVFKIRT